MFLTKTNLHLSCKGVGTCLPSFGGPGGPAGPRGALRARQEYKDPRARASLSK